MFFYYTESPPQEDIFIKNGSTTKTGHSRKEETVTEVLEKKTQAACLSAEQIEQALTLANRRRGGFFLRVDKMGGVHLKKPHLREFKENSASTFMVVFTRDGLAEIHCGLDILRVANKSCQGNFAAWCKATLKDPEKSGDPHMVCFDSF